MGATNNKQENKLVSVIIPTFRRPVNLSRAIDSVLNQTYKNIEIIVVDDNDSDSQDRIATKTLINENFADKIIYCKHPFNKNGSAARNTGIKASKGFYLSFLDDDDEMLPEKIERQVFALENSTSEYGICYTDYIRKNKDTIVGKSADNKSGNITIDLLLGRLYLSAGSNLLIRRDIVEKINGFDESYMRRQDIEFLTRASELSKVLHVDYTGLIIHKDDRSNLLNFTLEKHKENTEKFLSNFSYIKDKMSKKEQKKFVQSQYLFSLRSNLLRRNFKTSSEIMKEHDISMWLVIRFMIYSVNRKISKKIYGFKI